MTLEENSPNTNNKSNRIYYLDILRVIACLSVIMIHSSGTYVLKEFGSLNFGVGNVLDGLSRIAVPLFIMISGALMLDKNYNFSTKKLLKHISKMIVFFVFWSGIYCIIFQIVDKIIIQHQPFDIIKIIASLVEGHYHLWFIYLIIGLYLIVPLLRLWVKDENKKQVEYFIILSIIFTYIIPQIISIGSNYSNIFEDIKYILEKNLCLKYVGGYTAYFILGWYINNYNIKNKKIIYILGVVSLIITIFGTYILSVTTGKAIQIYGDLTINILFQSLMVFLFIKTKFINIESKKNKFITLVSKNSLGIYAIHAGIVAVMYSIISKIGIEIAIINIPIIFLFTFVISFLISYIFSKIPILKRFV